MSYQALYRVWRPQTFDELIGQPVITETLKNAISNQQISHAYLFTGPRGTGKTSAAKIFAKTINCPHQHDGNPCNECETCQLITQGQLGDVVEIDAASNNGVEEIRNLRENVRYAATSAKYKVYIIDEVHMLTTGAFNALLKTLEEPPENVIFILATTEPHKIPATIISRTQRFDFQRIMPQQLIERMVEILDHDKIEYDIAALEVIARAANGGMRDSLSLLDQALSYSTSKVSLESALVVSGSLNQLAFVDYIVAIHQLEGEKALDILHDQLQKGKQASRFVEELILFSRDALLTIYSKSNHTLLSEEELSPLQEIPTEYFYNLIDVLNDVQNKMRFSTQTDLYLEVMTIQMAQNNCIKNATSKNVENQGQNQEVIQLKAELRQLRQQMDKIQKEFVKLSQENLTQFNGEKNSPIASEENSINAEKDTVEAVVRTPRPRPTKFSSQYQMNVEQIYGVLNNATRMGLNELRTNWQRILGELAPQERAKFVGVEPLAAGPEFALLSFTNQTFAGLVQGDVQLQRHLNHISHTILGVPLCYYIILDKDWMDTRQNYAILRKGNKSQPIDISEENTLAMEEFKELILAKDNLSENEEVAQLEKKDIPNNSTELEDINGYNDEDCPPEITDVPDVVSKAIEIFGEENINIYYDK